MPTIVLTTAASAAAGLRYRARATAKIFYEKAMFSCAGRLITSFAMIYRSEQRQLFDRIVERVEHSFRPGRKC
jgi:hypothetical protein